MNPWWNVALPAPIAGRERQLVGILGVLGQPVLAREEHESRLRVLPGQTR
jgi:hypothetical protein